MNDVVENVESEETKTNQTSPAVPEPDGRRRGTWLIRGFKLLAIAFFCVFALFIAYETGQRSRSLAGQAEVFQREAAVAYDPVAALPASDLVPNQGMPQGLSGQSVNRPAKTDLLRLPAVNRNDTVGQAYPGGAYPGGYVQSKPSQGQNRAGNNYSAQRSSNLSSLTRRVTVYENRIAKNPGERPALVAKMRYQAINSSPESKHAAELLNLIQSVRESGNASGQELRQQVRRMVGQEFDRKIATQDAQVAAMLAKLDKIELQLRLRKENRDTIIDRRVSELLPAQDPLSWDFEINESLPESSDLPMPEPRQVQPRYNSRGPGNGTLPPRSGSKGQQPTKTRLGLSDSWQGETTTAVEDAADQEWTAEGEEESSKLDTSHEEDPAGLPADKEKSESERLVEAEAETVDEADFLVPTESNFGEY